MFSLIVSIVAGSWLANPRQKEKRQTKGKSLNSSGGGFDWSTLALELSPPLINVLYRISTLKPDELRLIEIEHEVQLKQWLGDFFKKMYTRKWSVWKSGISLVLELFWGRTLFPALIKERIFFFYEEGNTRHYYGQDLACCLVWLSHYSWGWEWLHKVAQPSGHRLFSEAAASLGWQVSFRFGFRMPVSRWGLGTLQNL